MDSQSLQVLTRFATKKLIQMHAGVLIREHFSVFWTAKYLTGGLCGGGGANVLLFNIKAKCETLEQCMLRLIQRQQSMPPPSLSLC